jgi:threonine dehydratase
MGRIYNNIVETVGRTPLVKLNKVTDGVDATIALKCEFFNPLGSVKDRIGMAMIEDAEEKGILTRDTVIVEPTSGNTRNDEPGTPDAARHAGSETCPHSGSRGDEGRHHQG